MATRYTAFISYSHKDTVWARWLQRQLETYRVPKAFSHAHKTSQKLGKVFRDRDDLASGQNLSEHLTQALEHADNLLVICSPSAAVSPWVNQEIEYFKSLGRGDRIFCLLIEGGAESLPVAVQSDSLGRPLEPLAADPRRNADGKRLAKLKIISGLLNTNLDQLVRREAVRQQRQLISVAALCVSVLGIGLWALFAEREKQFQINSNIESTVQLTEYTEQQYNYIDKASLRFVSELLNRYLIRFDTSELTDDQRVAVANTYRVLGNAGFRLGNTAAARRDLAQSKALYIAASTKNPGDITLAKERAFADFYLGQTYLEKDEFEPARALLASYAEQILQLYDDHPNHAGLLAESVYAPTALLAISLEQSARLTPALKSAIDQAERAATNALLIAPKNIELLQAYSSVMEYAADGHMKSCHIAEALSYRERAVIVAQEALVQDTKNREYQKNVANALYALADNQLNVLDVTVALKHIIEARNIIKNLYATDPDNQYLAGQNLNYALTVLALLTYHPDVMLLTPTDDQLALDDLVAELSSQEALTRATQNNIEPKLLLRLANAAMAAGQPARANTYSQQMLAAVKRRSDVEMTQYYSLIYAIQQRILGNTLSPELAKQVSAMTPQNNENCQSRFERWMIAVLNNATNAANGHAFDLWRLGDRGTEIAFFSRQLGLVFPPEPEPHDS